MGLGVGFGVLVSVFGFDFFFFFFVGLPRLIRLVEFVWEREDRDGGSGIELYKQDHFAFAVVNKEGKSQGANR